MIGLDECRLWSCISRAANFRAGAGLLLFFWAICLGISAFISGSPALALRPGNPRSLAGEAQLQQKSAADSPLTLTIVLNRDDQIGFEKSLQAIQNPSLPAYRHYLSPREQAERFGPSASSYNTVSGWLQGQGFTVIEGSANRLTLTVSGTRHQAEHAFQIHLDDYKLGDRIFYANDREPTLPDRIASHVQAVIGLSNRAKPEAVIAEELPLGGCLYAADVKAVNDPRYDHCAEDPFNDCRRIFRKLRAIYLRECLLSSGLFPNRGGNGPPGGGSGSNSSSLLTSSRLPSLTEQAATVPWLGVDGTGQKIGLLEFDTFNLQDMSNYFDLVGLPSTEINRLSQVHVNGGATVGPEEAEVLMDIVAVMTNARGAQVVVYDAPFTGIRTSFQTLFNKMISDGVTVISNSWVYCEDQTTLADVQSIDSVLASAAAAGITVLNSTGDFGSTCVDGSSNTVSVPADSPNATAVGGTSLTVGPASTYLSELFWNGQGQTLPSGPGGFGVSRFFTRPAYQNGFTTSPMRSIPDVSVNADPSKGIEICQADAGGCPTGAQYAGTSLAAPLWAAFVAILNQAQGQNLGALNSLLYPLGNTNSFHSAASMGSDFAHVGLGSPNLNLIHRALKGITPGAVSATVSEVQADPNGAVADGTSEAFVVVRLRDANGHTVNGKTVTLAGNAGSHASVTPATGISNISNGAVIFSVKDTTPEIITFTATDTTDGVVLQQTVDVAFGARPAAAGGIDATPRTVTANGSDMTTITVTLQDANGNPSPDKVVNLSQGNGGSMIVTATAKTDATGKAQFKAVDYNAESVTYTAVDLSDRNLVVPGNVTVNFVNSSGNCARPYNGTPAPGYAVSTFATGFPLDCFVPYAPIGLAVDQDGTFFVGDTIDSGIYVFGPRGGVASSATLLGRIPPSVNAAGLAGMAFTKDGRLYVAMNNGAKLLEVDPTTGNVIRVVVASLPANPLDLRVDPLSGDLFFSSGNGIFRITNFASGPGTVSLYASFDCDGFVFAQDGTIYGAGLVDIFRVTGINSPSPGIVTRIVFVNGRPDGLAVEENPANPSKPFLYANRNDGVITRIDTSALPATPPNCSDAGAPCTDIFTNGSRGDFVTVGNDGCLYATQSDRVIKVTKADGTCGLTPANPAPQLVLTPINVQPSPAQGSPVTFTASLKNVASQGNVPITLFATGANPIAQLVRTDGSGKAQITYTGIFAGADEVFAVADLGSSQVLSNTASVTWTNGRHSTFLTLNQSPGTGAPNKPIKLKASLVDVSVLPPAPIPNATVSFNLAGQSCAGATDVNGQVVCSVTPTVAAGGYELTANFAGTTQFLASSARRRFDLIVSPPQQLLNISTRMRVLTGDKVLIGGFIITGSESKKVIIRGIGPSLGGVGVPTPLQDPILELHPAGGPTVVNDNWQDTQKSEIEATGIAPTDPREAAIVATLPPGNHTAILSGKGGAVGGGLVEVYDLSQPASAELANISTRGFVDTGDNVMIAGVIVGPSSGTLAQALVRGIGPSLSKFGVPDVLQDPILELHNGDGATVATNDDWKIAEDGTSQQAVIESTTIPPTDNRESAILSPLAPGNYTAILRGKSNSTGVGLVEVYHLN